MPEYLFEVSFDDTRVICRWPDGTVKSLRWDELGEVTIETNDTGPVGVDVWWQLVSRDLKSSCAVPQGAKGEGKFISRLRELSGFDYDTAIAAMSCADNRSFLCWKSRQMD